MEQSSQVSSAAAASVPPEAAGSDEVLREELAKWRERVPKLAAALRQRAEETEVLKQEVERLRRNAGGGQDASAGIRARDERIGELEAKLADLAERHKTAQGELHGHRLEVDELRTEVAAWKGKWQALTRSLDEQDEAAGQRDRRGRELEDENERLRQKLTGEAAAHAEAQRALNDAVEERDSLRHRNEQLFETTELANRQIGSLTDSLAELRGNLKQLREREGELVGERDTLRGEVETLRARYAREQASTERLSRELQTARADTDGAQRQVAGLEERLQEALAAGDQAGQSATRLAEELYLVSDAAAAALRAGAEANERVAEAQRGSERARQQLAEVEHELGEAEQSAAALQARLDEQRQEVQRLTSVVEVAQRTTTEREDERRELSERLQAEEARSRHLEQQLTERSALVVALEQDQAETEKRRQAAQHERDELEEALIRAERNVKESTDHTKALDDKLERQKELMESLEEELAEAREEQARLDKARQDQAADAAAEVNRLQEQVRKLEVGAAMPQGDADEKVVLVLNQQLTDARARNEELLSRLRQLEASLGEGGTRERGDDLTRIHGIGQKLAEQLKELGIYRYQQIAELDATGLADEGHVLHGHRGRILRDGWIDQAVRLISH